MSALPFPNYAALGLIGVHAAGLATGSKKRYGYPLGPFGVLALSAPQLTSETLSNIKERKQCKDDAPGDKEPEGLCEDKEEES